MKSIDLVIRGYAKQEDGVWVAVCLDYDLASQGDSVQDSMEKLMLQIHEYVFDALVGDDKGQVKYLLRRRAPVSQWVTYYRYKALSKMSLMRDGLIQLIDLPLPLPLAPPKAV